MTWRRRSRRESFTGKAISYAQNQWDYLIRYTSNGLALIDNNVLERDIEAFCHRKKILALQ